MNYIWISLIDHIWEALIGLVVISISGIRYRKRKAMSGLNKAIRDIQNMVDKPFK